MEKYVITWLGPEDALTVLEIEGDNVKHLIDGSTVMIDFRDSTDLTVSMEEHFFDDPDEEFE